MKIQLNMVPRVDEVRDHVAVFLRSYARDDDIWSITSWNSMEKKSGEVTRKALSHSS